MASIRPRHSGSGDRPGGRWSRSSNRWNARWLGRTEASPSGRDRPGDWPSLTPGTSRPMAESSEIAVIGNIPPRRIREVTDVGSWTVQYLNDIYVTNRKPDGIPRSAADRAWVSNPEIGPETIPFPGRLHPRRMTAPGRWPRPLAAGSCRSRLRDCRRLILSSRGNGWPLRAIRGTRPLVPADTGPSPRSGAGEAPSRGALHPENLDGAPEAIEAIFGQSLGDKEIRPGPGRGGGHRIGEGAVDQVAARAFPPGESAGSGQARPARSAARGSTMASARASKLRLSSL